MNRPKPADWRCPRCREDNDGWDRFCFFCTYDAGEVVYTAERKLESEDRQRTFNAAFRDIQTL